MRQDRIKFDDKDTRTLLALLRMSGRSQYQAGQVLGTTKQNISIEEGEPRYQETVRNLTAKLAKEELPEEFLLLFEGADDSDSDEEEPAIDKIARSLYQ